MLDPRRVGKQNSGFSDEDISDIICILYPHSTVARQEVQRLALDDSPHVIGKSEVDGVEPDYEHEDHASRFVPLSDQSNYAIILRLSSLAKDPGAGFVFGRNHSRCDVVFTNDPHKRVSNIHFRIYPNEHGNVMIEDQSTNGTFVDGHLLSQQRGKAAPATPRWVLSSGAMIKVYLHNPDRDLEFRVRIPRRDDEYESAYLAKIHEYFARHGLKPRTGIPQYDGPPDIFKLPADPAVNRDGGREITPTEPPVPVDRSPSKKRNAQTRREWNGSGKYNRIGSIGKGAFAVVYKVTSKYDGNPYAAKELEKRRFIKNGVLDQKVENEMKIMQRVQHVSPNPVQR